MKVEWQKVVALAVIVWFFFLGFYLGNEFGRTAMIGATSPSVIVHVLRGARGNAVSTLSVAGQAALASSPEEESSFSPTALLGFKVGDTVRAVHGLKVRTAPNTYEEVGEQMVPAGASGKFLRGPVADPAGILWCYVRYGNGPTGWSRCDYLQKV